MKIRTVTVIGANGTMGANVSAIFASFGNARVYMVCRSLEKSKKAQAKAAKSVRAESITQNLIVADYSMLPECVAQSDLVFECVAEDMAIKLDITRKYAQNLPEDAFACSGTSGLSITALAEALSEQLRGQYFGVHMFNPPYNMTLCEVIPTRYSDTERFVELKQYLSDVLFRTVVEVKDSPAFLGNRIGFQFINEALQYAEQFKYSGGIDYIDAILGPFTGRAMQPLVTSDFVGLDVHKAITDNLLSNTSDYANETFKLPVFAQDLINQGKLGRKASGGLYKRVVYDNGLKVQMVYDIVTGTYRDKMQYVFPFAENMVENLKVGEYKKAFTTLIENRSVEAEICLAFLLKYIVYSLEATKQVGYDIHAADDVIAAGYNWCPPLALIEALSAALPAEMSFKQLLQERLDAPIINGVDLDGLLQRAEPSKYDYRRYFKAVH